ncbi:hypothetical protein DFH29DRAFT_817261 [Suillus ampliporus]|nr:hypothetical protein DFH29DRAFT_817261 [Suillus ampliporus]
MASTGVPLDTAAIISIALEGILYGFSVLMFIGNVRALTYKRAIRDINRPIVMVAILLLILSTAHMVVDIIRLEYGLVTYRNTFSGGPTAFFEDITQPTWVIKNEIYALQTMLGDGVVIYRCYVVWQSSRIIILPSMLWCLSSVAGLLAPYYASQATSGNIFTGPAAQWVTAFFILTLSTNLISSVLLAYRIWTTERKMFATRATEGTMTPIVRVVVDAAIMYSASLFSILICFICSNNAQYILTDMNISIISIAFYMVLIRIALRKTAHDHLSVVCSVPTNERERTNPRQYPMQPLQIHISQWTQNDGTSHEAGNEDRTLRYKAESSEGASCNV